VTLAARYPVALLPVRLETRFEGSLLRVRIFPDEIWADTHETGLTPDERADGNAYVAAMHDGLVPEREAWGRLVARWTAQRAAFIVRAVLAGSTEVRAESWTRAAQAELPDRWLVRAYAGASVVTMSSAAVQRPLPLTLSPASTPADRVPIADGLSIDADLQWTIDFSVAEKVGMAVTLDLTKPDGASAAPLDPSAGIDLLLAVGVSDTEDPADAAARLRALFDAHHHTRGLAFLRPGTPTNNTPAAPAAFPPEDPGGADSFTVERAAPLIDATSDPGASGVLFVHALGLPPQPGDQVAAVEHVEDANFDPDTAAAAMNDALWPATLGYFMEQMMAPKFDTATIDAARRFWVDHVRPGGPLSAFRIGRVPYGMLPAVSLTRLAGDGEFVPALRALRDRYFVPAAANAPQIAPGSSDPDGDLLQVLALDASCRAVRMRVLLGPEVTTNTAGWLGSIAAEEEQLRLRLRVRSRTTLLRTVGLGAQTRLGGLDAGTFDELIGGPLVAAGTLSEEFGLDGPDGKGVNYIRWLHDNAIAHQDAVRNDALPGQARPLLYRLLRHALLVEMDRVAFGQLAAANVVSADDRPEAALVRLTPAETRLTSYERIDRAVAFPAFAGSLAPYLARLATLAELPTAELDRRFGETLDACSHRLDAWITAAATQRLWSLREGAPTGCHLGAYGWVEDIRPAAAEASPGGFIHAPSSAHASAAAVLRNGYLSRGGSGSAYDVDLSSARVRDALVLLDGTRQGEPLAALLGQRFERELHARQLERLIASLRGHFPLLAGKTPEGDGPTELVAAGNVVDGLALRRAWNEQTPPFGASSDLPPLTTAQSDSFHTALDSLNNAVDAVADVLTAESIYQAVQGNPMAAAASLDAMSQGVHPPRPEVVRTPMGGVSFTQRLAVALAASAPPPGEWGPRTPRAEAEPSVDHWVGTLLGSPGQIGCRVLLVDGGEIDVRLDQLALRPLDLVALARTTPSGLGDGELDRRVLAAVSAPAGSKVLYGATDLKWSFGQALELSRTVGELLGVARPLTPSDLVAPADAANATLAQYQAADAVARARAALDALNGAAAALDAALAPVAAALSQTPHPEPTAEQLAALRAALRGAAAFGIAGAYPPSETDIQALASLAGGVRKEMTVRLVALPPAGTTDPAALVAAATDAVWSVLGRDFLFLPALSAPALSTPLTASAALVGDPSAPRQALQQLARVRPNLGRWRSLWLYGQAFGSAAPSLEVVQMPAATVWAGRPGAEIPNGTLSLILHRPTQAAPVGGWAGFVIDEWIETVPSKVQNTALSFRYEAPVAEAPQAVLLAVPPTNAASWDEETLLDTVRETLMLAKIRAVDGALLDGLRPFLPAICLTGNTGNEATSTDLFGSIVAEPGLRSS
jgi:hypothetical protein